jgi:hypothetical protein
VLFPVDGFREIREVLGKGSGGSKFKSTGLRLSSDSGLLTGTFEL